jgi:hypothetical protein
MKRVPFTLLILLFVVYTARAQNNVGINDNNSSPKASAMLDVYSTSKGMLIPRLALTSTTTASPVTSPETSLLIYNTATTGDVTPGYYYWNASKWVRLRGATDPPKIDNIVTKTASAALLKTENLVLANCSGGTNGSITLTLPAITSTDDGLEISVKNIGTYTDLVTVVPSSGTIDATTASNLTRWKGRTYVAKNSNWYIKEKETRTDNILDVSTNGSFTTIAEVVAYLNLHISGPTVVRLGGGNYTITATITINLSEPVTFEGLSFGMTYVESTVTGSPMFDCQTECYFKMIDFTGASTSSGTDGVHCSGTNEYYEIKDCNFMNFDKAVVVSASNEIWVFETDFSDIASAGIEIAAGSASGGTTNIAESDFGNIGKGISLTSGNAWIFAASSCNFYPAAGQIGIYYNPTNFTSFVTMIISNDGWNNIGTFVSGFDFTRTDGRDANAFIDANHGMESKNPHFNISVLNNNSTTTVTTANAWYKASWTNTTTYPSSWIIVNNKVTYLPVNKRDVTMWISGCMSVAGSNRTLSVAIVKNGVTSTRYGEMKVRTSTTNQPYTFSTVVYLEDVSPGNYYELYVSSSTAADVIKIQDLSWFSSSN